MFAWLINYLTRDPKTTAVGVVGFIASLLSAKGKVIPMEWQNWIVSGVILALGLLSRDSHNPPAQVEEKVMEKKGLI